MRISVKPSATSGTVTAPASKSAMQRACALALLHEGETTIINPGKSNDDLAALEIIQNLGARVQYISTKAGEEERIIVQSSRGWVNKTAPELHCGESGLSLRMFTPIAALSPTEIRITGSGSLLNRPIGFFDELLPSLGVTCSSNYGKLPLLIRGPLIPANISIDGSLSSQFLTGLLMAFAKAATSPVTITVHDLASKPYIDLSLEMMRHFGYSFSHDHYATFHIGPVQPAAEGGSPVTYRVEGDWSGAAFLLVAGAIAGGITVHGLLEHSSQADRAILDALRMAGVWLSITETAIAVIPNTLRAFTFDATDCPDLFPPLVALAAYASGVSVITGVQRLTHKESNRALTLQAVFEKMGIGIQVRGNQMLVTGGTVKTATVASHHDHRIAMAAAVAALGATGKVIIDDAEAVNKSYPDFFEHLKMLGADVSLPSNL